MNHVSFRKPELCKTTRTFSRYSTVLAGGEPRSNQRPPAVFQGHCHTRSLCLPWCYTLRGEDAAGAQVLVRAVRYLRSTPPGGSHGSARRRGVAKGEGST